MRIERRIISLLPNLAKPHVSLRKELWGQRSVKKVTLTVFRDMKRSISIDFLEKSATINSASYSQLLWQNSHYSLNILRILSFCSCFVRSHIIFIHAQSPQPNEIFFHLPPQSLRIFFYIDVSSSDQILSSILIELLSANFISISDIGNIRHFMLV